MRSQRRFDTRKMMSRFGEHFCMGAHLVRKTRGAIFRELVTRIESVEFTGTPERTASNLVPGFKQMPIRYRIRPGAEP